MKLGHLLMTAAPLAIASPALAETDTRPVETTAPAEPQAQGAAKPVSSDTVTTGVARGRDRLDSAVSTSSLKEAEISKLAPRSIAELLRDVPGVRSEASTGEGSSSITIRGLPISAAGSKFLQLQDDGLPILEFGDISFGTSDSFLRADLNLAQVDVIRGGSASTFASNSPGGIINFVSKTGEVEGGAVELTGGLDYDNYRIDMDYGAHISDTLRFHVGGFYRQGEGPRRTGYDANKGGQIKLNITKEFEGGYIRFYGKYLDDRTPFYDVTPMRVTGSNDDPTYSDVTGFDASRDSLLSANLGDSITLDSNNNLQRTSVRDGQRAIAKSVGFEANFDFHGWNVSERFRFSDISSHLVGLLNAQFLPAAIAGAAFGGPGATLRYASGPNRGQAITDVAGINGNGLVAGSFLSDTEDSLDNLTNDLRVSRAWSVGKGELTTTAGLYTSRQTIDIAALWSTVLTDVRGDGQTALVDLVNAAGVPLTQGGYFGFGSAFFGPTPRGAVKIDYDINAPFGSLNYRIGRFAFGASVRYDAGSARGVYYGAGPFATRDINSDGTISSAERLVATLGIDQPFPINYDYNLLSYSVGVNFRIAEPLAVFARYSRGGRANAERIIFPTLINARDGSLTDPGVAVDLVRQAEAGVKYRKSNLTLNLTGFWAATEDTNIDTTAAGALIFREYSAKGLEFEGGYRVGPFGLTAAATYTDAEITADRESPALIGNTPKRQAKFIFQATPQITTDRFSVGAVFIGTTKSFASDTNQLKIPAYVTTNAFVQFRPAERLLLSLNANNVFDVTALTGVDANIIPMTGVVAVRALNGRTVSASARFEF